MTKGQIYTYESVVWYSGCRLLQNVTAPGSLTLNHLRISNNNGNYPW